MAAFKRVGSSVSSRSSGSELDEWDSEMVASLVNTHGLRVAGVVASDAKCMRGPRRALALPGAWSPICPRNPLLPPPSCRTRIVARFPSDTTAPLSWHGGPHFQLTRCLPHCAATPRGAPVSPGLFHADASSCVQTLNVCKLERRFRKKTRCTTKACGRTRSTWSVT
jgi:hypothetical protein